MSGEIRHPDDDPKKPNKSSDQHTKKSEEWRRNLGNPKNEGSKTDKLGDTPTHKLGVNSGTGKFDEEWGQRQLGDLADYWRKSGQLEDAKRRADKLGIDLPEKFTQKLGSGSPEHDSVLNVEPPPAYDSLDHSQQLLGSGSLKHDSVLNVEPIKEATPPPYVSSDHYGLQIEATQKPEVDQDIKQIAEVPKGKTQSSSSYSPEQKANNRKHEMLPTDRMRVLGLKDPLRPIFPRNN